MAGSNGKNANSASVEVVVEVEVEVEAELGNNIFLEYSTGWGATEESLSGAEQSEFLAQLDITVNSSAKHTHLIETNTGIHGADPCQGDSGGPLLLKKDGEWLLIGTLLGGGFRLFLHVLSK